MSIQTKISLNNFKIFAYHGYYPEEQVLGQWYIINIELILGNNPESENLDDSLDYTLLAQIVREEMGIKRQLLETIIDAILDRILKLKEGIEFLEVEILKPNLLLKGISVDSKVSKIYTKN